jgi:hypothetical protein
MKLATILDEDDGMFGLEYENTLGTKNLMRLDAVSYDRAIREAKSFLEIDEDNLDGDGMLWQVE